MMDTQLHYAKDFEVLCDKNYIVDNEPSMVLKDLNLIEFKAKEIEKTRTEIVSILSNHTEQDPEKIFKDIDRDYWMSANEAFEYGMIDKIITKKV